MPTISHRNKKIKLYRIENVEKRMKARERKIEN